MSETGWVEDGFDDEDDEYTFRAPLRWRLAAWILNDLARLPLVGVWW